MPKDVLRAMTLWVKDLSSADFTENSSRQSDIVIPDSIAFWIRRLIAQEIGKLRYLNR